MNLENRLHKSGFLKGNILGKLVPYVAAAGLAAMTLAGCSNPIQPPTPPSQTSPPPSPPSSGNVPGEPSLSLTAGPNTTASTPYTGSSPKRAIQISISDSYNDETNFTLEKQIGNGPWTVIANLPAGATSYTDNNVFASTLYAYGVRANNAAGSSSWFTKTITSVGPQYGEIVLPDIQDATVSETSPNSPSDQSNIQNQLWVVGAPNGGTWAGYDMISYILFPYNQIPSNATSITSATLSIYNVLNQLVINPSNPPIVSIGQLSSSTLNPPDWNGSVTWNTRPFFSGFADYGGYVFNTGTTLQWSMIDIVNNWFNGTSNLNDGVQLFIWAGDGETNFDSRNSLNPPTLTIDYMW